MKKIIFSFLICSLWLSSAMAQFTGSVKGIIVDSETQVPLINASILIQNTGLFQRTNSDGTFIISDIPAGNQVLQIIHKRYQNQIFPVLIKTNSQIDLGIILLEIDLFTITENNGLISLTEDDLNDDNGQSEYTTGFLQSSRDLFQNRAAFDFGQAFFRIRGYDSQYSQVLINGVSMNKLFNQRPQWNNWGGLNDATRNQELSFGLTLSNLSFGDLLGTTNISTRATQYRPGFRLSSSYSNRTYTGRAMVTFNSGLQTNGLGYSVSASRRWGNEGFIDGTLYDAFGFFGALEFKFSPKNSLNLTAIYSPSRRASVSAITERVFNELGRTYNPYWGIQNGNKRNSRMRKVDEPIFMFNHFYEGEHTLLTTAIAYQTGKQSRSRLDYANAPNPNPNYWRYLPLIVQKPQIDWNSLYEANTNTSNISDGGSARYLLYEDITNDELLTVTSILNNDINDHFTIDIGGSYKALTSQNYAKPVDLLGALYYADVNQFTLINGHPAKNDALGKPDKGLDDRIKYNYTFLSTQINGFSQFKFSYNKFDFFLSGSITATNYQRIGKFLNESFPDNSIGESEKILFNDFGLKGGFTYKPTGRHLVMLNGTYMTKVPGLRNAFVNSRENNNLIIGLESEKITSAEMSYVFRSPVLKSRITGYYTEFNDGTDINFVFAQIGTGTDFFQEVVTNIDKRHFGVELGFEYQASPTVKTFAAAAYGIHTFTNNATVSINFDTAGFNNDLINEIGFKNLGETNIKDLRVANGPQQAYSIGVEYRDPKKWWISASANYLSHAYVDVSTITRTSDFYINPDDPLGMPFENIDTDLANKLLKQERFDGFYLLNLTGGKSWRFKGKYLSLFISVNNAFDELFRTGGYEQSRTANYADLVEDTSNGNDDRSFGNKYWYGYGRSYFINLAYNF